MLKEFLFVSATVSNDAKIISYFCQIGVTEIIKSLTRRTCSSTSLADYILAFFPKINSHEGVMLLYQITNLSITLGKLVNLKL